MVKTIGERIKELRIKLNLNIMRSRWFEMLNLIDKYT